MRVHFPKEIWAKVRAYAREYYPREVIVALVGKRKRSEVWVEGVYKPPLTEVTMTEDSVQTSVKFIEAVEQLAKEEGCIYLGTLHSHPCTEDSISWAVPSLQDWKGAYEDPVLFGVFTIEAKGRRWKYDVQFFRSDAYCEVVSE